MVIFLPFMALPLAPILATVLKDTRTVGRVYLGSALLTLVLAVAAALTGPSGAGLLSLAGPGRLLFPLTAIIGALAILASQEEPHATRDPSRAKAYFFWLHAFWGSLLLLSLSQNLGLSWLAVELTTLTSAVLVAFPGGKTASEAAWKYVILCSVGLLIALMAILIVFSLASRQGAFQLSALDYTALTHLARHMPPALTRLAGIFLAVGLGTKVGFAPLHTWLPDAHSEAPAPVSGLLSGILLALVLVVLWQAEKALAPATGAGFGGGLLMGFGLLSVMVATPFILAQTDLKRILAYSSLEQMGLIAVGLGIGSPVAVAAAFTQLVTHAFVKSALFFTAGDLLQSYGTKALSRITGLLESHPVLGLLWMMGLLTLAGLPPLPMFPSEMALLLSALQKNVWLGVGLVVFLGAIFVGLAHAVLTVALGERKGRSRKTPLHGWPSAILALSASLPAGLLLPGLIGRLIPEILKLAGGG